MKLLTGLSQFQCVNRLLFTESKEWKHGQRKLMINDKSY